MNKQLGNRLPKLLKEKRPVGPNRDNRRGRGEKTMNNLTMKEGWRGKFHGVDEGKTKCI